MIRSFLIALQFMTRLPAPHLNELSAKEIGRSQYYYPVVGLIIGLVLFTIAQSLTILTSSLSAAIVLTLWVVLTGALHIDGLADCADAWVGGLGDKQKTLEIMKDPQSGPMAVTVVICLLLLKFAALQSIIEHKLWLALILAPVLARNLLPLLFHTTDYVRKSGLGSALTQYRSATLHYSIQFTTVMLSFYLIGWSSIVIITCAILLYAAIRQLSIKRIGGITGDVAGALVELSEVVVLIAFLIISMA